MKGQINGRRGRCFCPGCRPLDSAGRWAVVLVGWLILVTGSVFGQGTEPDLDLVQFRVSPADAVRSVQGIVVDLNPRSLELKLPSGSMRRLNRAEIVAVQLRHHEPWAKAERAAAMGDFTTAQRGFEEILKQDVPHWMKRLAAARRIQVLRLLNQYRTAVPLFVALANDAPDQVPYEAVPVVWGSLTIDALLEEQVKQWLNSRQDWERLCGASLGLLHGPTSAASRQVLEEFVARTGESGRPDPLAAIATAQLWRVPRAWTAEPLRALQSTIDQFPAEIKAGPWLVLGRLRKSAGETAAAADAFLQIPAVYPEQHDLVLLGLESAYLTLRDTDPQDAVRVGRWLVQQFPDSPQADVVRAQIERAR